MRMILGLAALAALIGGVPAAAQPAAPVEAEARTMLAELVAFRSVEGHGDVRRMADYLKAQFIAAGFAPEDIQIVEAGAPGLIVRFRGDGTADAPPVLFLAHMDVVDANPAEWNSDPWTLTERDGALHGRGVVDNKFGVLTLAQAFIRLKREGFVPTRDLVIAFSGDEETGMASTRALAAKLMGAAFAINSDAGGGYRAEDGTAAYIYQAAEKTYATFALTARNRGGHSSRPRADNAIYDLSRALNGIAALQFPLRWNDVTLASFTAMAETLPPEARPVLEGFVANPSVEGAEAVIALDAGFASEFRTTCVATMLKAGIAENALPTEAEALVNCRIFPGESIASVESALKDAVADPAIEVRLTKEAFESPVSALPEDARRALDAVLAVRAPGAVVTPYMEAGGTDGVHFRRAGIATIGMGPLIGGEDSEYNYHGIDERLPLEVFGGGLDHFYVMMKALSQASSSTSQ